MATATEPVKPHVSTDHHPRLRVGPTIAVYVWQYPLRLVHWGLVICIGVLSFTGYYIHNPFIVGQTSTKFMMGWFRFVHESFGMAFIAFFLLRFYLFFAGDRWVRWQAMVPLRKEQWKEMFEVMKFYAFIRPTPVSKVGHNAIAAFSYIGIYTMVFIEIITGLAMYNWLGQSPILTPLVGWIPRFINIGEIRLIHFGLMFVFIAFGIFHVHLCLIVSSAEKRGLMDSIFTGYKIIPVDELEEDDRKAIAASKGKEYSLMNETLVLGLGNLVHADDGVGVHAIHALQCDPRVPPGVTLLDGGTQGMGLLHHISGVRRLLVVDAIDVGEPAGTLLRFEGKSLRGLPGKASVHQLGFADLMIALQLLGESPEEVVVFGVQPKSTEWSASLTEPVAKTIAPLVDQVVGQLESWRVTPVKRAVAVTAADVAFD